MDWILYHYCSSFIAFSLSTNLSSLKNVLWEVCEDYLRNRCVFVFPNLHIYTIFVVSTCTRGREFEFCFSRILKRIILVTSNVSLELMAQLRLSENLKCSRKIRLITKLYTYQFFFFI